MAATVATVAYLGLEARAVEVQVQLSSGLPHFIVTARPLVLLTAPLIYAGWFVFGLLDLFVANVGRYTSDAVGGTGYAPAEWRLRTLSGTRCSGNICTTGIDQTVLVNRAIRARAMGGRK